MPSSELTYTPDPSGRQTNRGVESKSQPKVYRLVSQWPHVQEVCGASVFAEIEIARSS